MTNVSDNNWTFTMLDGNVEFVIEYDTDLVLWEENVNTTVLEEQLKTKQTIMKKVKYDLSCLIDSGEL